MLQYKLDDQGGPQPPPSWKEPAKPSEPEKKPDKEKDKHQPKK